MRELQEIAICEFVFIRNETAEKALMEVTDRMVLVGEMVFGAWK